MEPTQAKAEETPASAAPAKEAGTPTQQPAIGDAKTALSSTEVSLDDLDAVQTASAKVTAEPSKPAVGGEVKPEETPKGEAPPKTEETPAAEAPKTEETPVAAKAEETPAAEPTKEPEPTEEKLPDRFRFKDETDRLVAALKKRRPELSWAEAEALVKPVAVAPEIHPDPVAAVTTVVDGLKSEIAVLEKKVAPEGEDEVLSTPEMRKAQVELTAKRAELVRQEIKLENTQAQIEAEQRSRADAHTKARNESKGRALALYPDAGNADTTLGKAISQRFEEMKDPNHPDNPILYADTAPERVTEIVARELGIQPKAKTPSAQPTEKVPAAQPQKKAAPVSGAKTSVPEKPAEATPNQRSIEHLRSEKASLEELDAAFGATGGLVAAIR